MPRGGKQESGDEDYDVDDDVRNDEYDELPAAIIRARKDFRELADDYQFAHDRNKQRHLGEKWTKGRRTKVRAKLRKLFEEAQLSLDSLDEYFKDPNGDYRWGEYDNDMRHFRCWDNSMDYIDNLEVNTSNDIPRNQSRKSRYNDPRNNNNDNRSRNQSRSRSRDKNAHKLQVQFMVTLDILHHKLAYLLLLLLLIDRYGDINFKS